MYECETRLAPLDVNISVRATCIILVTSVNASSWATRPGQIAKTPPKSPSGSVKHNGIMVTYQLVYGSYWTQEMQHALVLDLANEVIAQYLRYVFIHEFDSKIGGFFVLIQ